jgi:hypothetical protein
LARHAGHRGAVKEAQALSLCKASVFFGAQVPRGREARSGESGERSSQSPRAHGGGTHLGLCLNAPPFAGRCGTQRPMRWSAPRSREANHQVRATRARGSASRCIARATNEVCGTGSRRGLARRNIGANLHSSRPGPRRARFFGGMRCAARQPASVPARGRTKAKARRGSSPPRAERGCEAARGECPCIALFAEVGRTPSGSEKRVTGSEWVESPFGIRSA